MNMYFFDEAAGDHVVVPTDVDKDAGKVTARIEHFTVYLPMAMAQQTTNVLPYVAHQSPFPATVRAGAPIQLRVTVRDWSPAGSIAGVQVFYRALKPAPGPWLNGVMKRDTRINTLETYCFLVPASFLSAADMGAGNEMEYYVRITDNLGAVRTSTTRGLDAPRSHTAGTVALNPPTQNISVGFSRYFAVRGTDNLGTVYAFAPETVSLPADLGEATNHYAGGALFLAKHDGSGQLRAGFGTEIGAASIRVYKGNLQSIKILDTLGIPLAGTQNVREGAQLVLDVLGYDEYGNHVLLVPAWTVGGGIGSMSSNVFTAQAVDTTTVGEITATIGGVSAAVPVRVVNDVAAPDVLLPPGLYNTAQSVALSSLAPGAQIRYTTNGFNPTPTSGLEYSGPIEVNRSMTIRAIAYQDEWSYSAITNADYVITGKVDAPVITPGTGVYVPPQNIVITSVLAGAEIRYTTNGTVPSATNGYVYTASFQMRGPLTVRAMAWKSNWDPSDVTEVVLTAKVPTPVLSLTPGTYSLMSVASVRVYISAQTIPGVVLRYTVDGSDPSETSGLVIANNGYVDVLTTQTLKCIAYAQGWSLSDIIGGLYIVKGVPRTGAASQRTDRDDGYYKVGVEWPSPRFTQINSWVIRDNLTQLHWAKMISDGSVNWDNAFGKADWYNQQMIGGVNTWRLPNIIELDSLVNHWGVVSPDDYLAQSGFGLQPKSGGDFIWSSTSDVNNTFGQAFGYHVGGEMGSYGKTASTGLVWLCYRPSSLPKTGQTVVYRQGDDGYWQSGRPWPVPRFVVSGGVVIDKLTGLMWNRGPFQFVNGTQWQSAIWDVYTSGQTGFWSGYSDWRVPNVRELMSLIHFGQDTATMLANASFSQVNVKNILCSTYWTSEDASANPGKVPIFSFDPATKNERWNRWYSKYSITSLPQPLFCFMVRGGR